MAWHTPNTRSRDGEVLRWLLLIASLLAFVLLLQLLLPWLLLGGVGAVVLWLWRRHLQRNLQRHTLFYELIQQRGGRISALEFAIAAQLTGLEARRFLDARAREFFGNFEPTNQGDVLYTFDVRNVSPQSPAAPPPESESLSLLTTDGSWDASLSLDQLAARFNCSVALLQQQKWAADFAYWSQERDPEGWAWRIDPISDRGYRLE